MRNRSTSSTGGLVYSTGLGKMCPGCCRPLLECVCGTQNSTAAKDGIVRVGRETKGRKGSGVTVVTGLPLNSAQLTELCSDLKRRCGSGGTVKDGVIEIQGEHRDTIVLFLTQKSYTVKRIGA